MATEPKTATSAQRPDFIMETSIACTPERLWEVLTQSTHVQLYHFAGCTLNTSMKPDGRFDHYLPDGNLMLGGKLLSLDPPKRLEMTFEPAFFGPDAPASRCVYEIERTGDGCRFCVLHYGLPEGQSGVIPGWANIAERVKHYAEHGNVDAITAREAAMRGAAA